MLTRRPASIMVLEAADGPGQVFTCTETGRRGPLATLAESRTAPCASA
ncbi:hypothetical protein ACIPSA_29575 [Streptomyces sp. NPDC086549]